VLLSIVPVVAAVAIVATAAIGSDSESGSTAPRANEVVIEDFVFAPDPLPVKAGSTVRVQNLDDAAHTLTADDDSFDTGNLAGGATKTVVLDTPGRYAYHCAIHDYMTGVIRVDR
jgi:plastocyanin